MKPLRKSGGSHFSDILRCGPDISGPHLSMSEKRRPKTPPEIGTGERRGTAARAASSVWQELRRESSGIPSGQ